MATIIDSLIVTLGLNPEGFDKGRKQTSEGLKRTREDAEKTGATFGKFTKGASEGIGALRNEAIGLFLAFQGASSIKSFVGNMITGDAAAGRLAANLGTQTLELSAYGLAIKSVGGSTEEATAAFSMLAQAREQLKLTGDTGHNREFMLLGFGPHDLDDPARAMVKLAEAAQKMPRTQFYNLAHQMGITDGVINLLELGPAKMRELVKAREADAAATQLQAQRAAALEARWAELSAKLMAVVRPNIYSLTDSLMSLTDGLTQNANMSPIYIAALGGIAVAAAAMGSPFIAAAAAVLLLATNFDKLKKGLEAFTAEFPHLFEWHTDKPPGYSEPAQFGFSTAGGYAPRRTSAGNPGVQVDRGQGVGNTAPGAAYIRAYLKAMGLSDDQAKGVAAGIAAEAGGLGQAPGAGFGIGQWRGPRLTALKAKYGNAPSLPQQLEFLLSELHGGDRGGAAVLGQKSADATLVAYLSKFMRPQGANNEHYIDLVRDILRGRRALGGVAGGGSQVTIGTIVLPHVANAEQFAKQLPAAIRRRTMTGQASTGMD